MLHAQAEVQSKIQDQKLEATIVEADMAEIVAAHKEQASTVRKGPTWLAALSGSVRPVVTHLPDHHRVLSHQLDKRLGSDSGGGGYRLEPQSNSRYRLYGSCLLFGNRTFGKRKT